MERQGARASSPLLVILVRPASTKPGHGGRVGFTVSKKVGNAVVRNFVKRRLRERLRQQRALWATLDLVVIAKPEAGQADTQALWSSLDGLLAQLPSIGTSTHGQQKDPRRPNPAIPQDGRPHGGKPNG
jgi:ribonuclease P protein component